MGWALALLSTIAWGATAGADWPQWNGPGRDGMSAETGLLQEWPAEGPPLAWTVDDLGGGHSAPSIAEGRIFGMSHRGDDEVVWALSEKDGSPNWVTRLGPAFGQDRAEADDGPGATPTVDGDLLYVQGLAGDVSCLRVETGELVWQRDLRKDFGADVPRWSFRESPLIEGDLVIVTPGAPGATLVALDKLTGATRWQSAVPGDPGPAYSSAIAIGFDGRRQIVQFTAQGLVGVAASDGAFLWRYDPPSNPYGINISTPIHHQGQIFASSAYGNGGGLVTLRRADSGGVTADEVYFTPRMQNHHGGMILLDGALFGADGGNSGGYLVALDFATGEVLWDQRAGRLAPKGAIAYADGRLYYRTEDGAMLLVEPSREEYLERGRFEQPDRSGKPAWTHPVLANGRLYLRDQGTLLAYDVRATKPRAAKPQAAKPASGR
ncbi:MAG: PQQ-binding-like beta-propeller repeat protein [Acidobacteriota bacterium]